MTQTHCHAGHQQQPGLGRRTGRESKPQPLNCKSTTLLWSVDCTEGLSQSIEIRIQSWESAQIGEIVFPLLTPFAVTVAYEGKTVQVIDW